MISMMKKLSLGAALALTASVVAVSPAQAVDFDFNGTFAQDNNVLLFDFTTDSDSTVTIFSSSWVEGGFDPILSLFDSTGNLIQFQDDGATIGSTASNGVSYNHGIWDTYFTQLLTAGTYTVAITQFNNFAVGPDLSHGFERDGVGNDNFTAAFGCSQGAFCGASSQLDATGDPNFNRTNAWRFHILNVAQADVVNPPAESVPEPASVLGLAMFGALGAGSMLKRKQQEA